jgi:O-antigen biosynthesis protein WbqP
MKRTFDILLSVSFLIVFLIPMAFIALAIILTSKGSVLYWSNRVGQNEIIFRMPKFRTMKIETPDLPSHLINNANSYFTPIGGFLRKYSLDELPQLFSIFIGDMSFVGPRPALFNQDDLIELRREKEINFLKPGLTGWAQINGRDELSIIEKVDLDFEYLNNKSLRLDLKIFMKTFLKVVHSKNISH